MMRTAPSSRLRENVRAASLLRELARLLEEQRANPFRVVAYQRAADTVERLGRRYDQILTEEGRAGLDRLPGIGPRIALALEAIAATGRLPMLERLQGERDPESVLASLPSIGRRLAERLHQELGIASLEDLEVALHRGTLGTIKGLGPKRQEAVLAVIRDRLSGPRREPVPTDTPPVEEILDVDREYRVGAERGTLPTIAPRRFNPEHQAWLPLLHTRRGDKDYTALFSNTALAHRLDRTRDWVVIYWDGTAREHQATVVTERRGPLKGRRVIRGREAECLEYFGVHAPIPSEVVWFEGLGPGGSRSAVERATRPRQQKMAVNG